MTDEPLQRESLQTFFRPIVGARAFAEVVDQLTYAVLSGRFSVGDRLPTIDELARLMKVSKPTVGEAVKVLVDAKVLRVQRGAFGGVEVASASVPRKALRLSSQRRARKFGELVEARRAIEYELARLACQRATEQDLDEMQEYVDTLRRAKVGGRDWDRANSMFHYAMGRAAQSELLAFYQHQVIEEMTVFLGAFPPRYSDPETSIAAHEETLTALRTRDPEVAAHAMAHHLADLEGTADTVRERGNRSAR